MEPVVITPALIFSALLSLLLEWLPGLRTWFEALTPAKKATVNALGVALVATVSVLGACYWWGDTCPESTWQTIGNIFLMALLGIGTNQGVHLLTKRQVVRGKSRVARQA